MPRPTVDLLRRLREGDPVASEKLIALEHTSGETEHHFQCGAHRHPVTPRELAGLMPDVPWTGTDGFIAWYFSTS